MADMLAGNKKSFFAAISLPAIFTVTMVLFPLLDVVESPFSGFSLGTVAVLISEFALIAFSGKHEVRIGSISCFVLYAFCMSLVLLLSGVQIYSEGGLPTALLRLFKFALIVLPVFLFSLHKSVNVHLAFKVVRLVCIISSLYVMIQQVFLAVGIVVPNAFTQVAASDLYLTSGFGVEGSSSFRPSGLFLEPSHMSQYCLPFLLWQAFDPVKSEKRLPFLIVVSLGVVLTGSGMGVLGVAAILLAYFVSKAGKNALMIFAIAALFFISLLAFQTDFMQSVMERLFTANVSGGGNAFEARIDNGMEIYFAKDIVVQIFGSGFGNVPASYMNGLEYVLNTLGIVGVVLLVASSISAAMRFEAWGKMVILLYFVLLLGAQVFTAATFSFYCILAYLSAKRSSARKRADAA